VGQAGHCASAAFHIPSHYCLEDIERDLKSPPHGREAGHRFRLITNAIAELEGWAAFHPEDWGPWDPPGRKTPGSPPPPDPALPASDLAPKPFVREPKIGRNAPCPCGSGKKYKKCCGK
jgi:hypothetical protein